MICETDAERSEARTFFGKNMEKGPKIHCLSLRLYAVPPNCITGASKSRGQRAWVPMDLDPPVVFKNCFMFFITKQYESSMMLCYGMNKCVCEMYRS